LDRVLNPENKKEETMRVRKKKRVLANIKDQKEFPTACGGYLWGTKKAKKAKNKRAKK
jgi:hypothetical protein